MPGFGLERPAEMGFQGVYRLTSDGTLHCEANDFDQPNGLCLSPDEGTLYVNDTTRAHIRAFDVDADGALAAGASSRPALAPVTMTRASSTA